MRSQLLTHTWLRCGSGRGNKGLPLLHLLSAIHTNKPIEGQPKEHGRGRRRIPAGGQAVPRRSLHGAFLRSGRGRSRRKSKRRSKRSARPPSRSGLGERATKGHGSQWWPHARLTEPRAQGVFLGERSHASLATHGVQAGGPRWKVAVMIWPYYFEQAPSADAPETVPRRGSNR